MPTEAPIEAPMRILTRPASGLSTESPTVSTTSLPSDAPTLLHSSRLSLCLVVRFRVVSMYVQVAAILKPLDTTPPPLDWMVQEDVHLIFFSATALFSVGAQARLAQLLTAYVCAQVSVVWLENNTTLPTMELTVQKQMF